MCSVQADPGAVQLPVGVDVNCMLLAVVHIHHRRLLLLLSAVRVLCRLPAAVHIHHRHLLLLLSVFAAGFAFSALTLLVGR